MMSENRIQTLFQELEICIHNKIYTYAQSRLYTTSCNLKLHIPLQFSIMFNEVFPLSVQTFGSNF